jgi:hypothetical protein
VEICFTLARIPCYGREQPGSQPNFHSDNVEVPGYFESVNKPIHYALQVQKTRLRVWANGTKLFDIPRGVNTKDTLNQLYFKMENSNYKDDEVGYYLTNLKVAAVCPIQDIS